MAYQHSRAKAWLPWGQLAGQAKFFLCGSHILVLVLPFELEERLTMIIDLLGEGAAIREGWGSYHCRCSRSFGSLGMLNKGYKCPMDLLNLGASMGYDL